MRVAPRMHLTFKRTRNVLDGFSGRNEKFFYRLEVRCTGRLREVGVKRQKKKLGVGVKKRGGRCIYRQGRMIFCCFGVDVGTSRGEEKRVAGCVARVLG